ncbi:hypothetical protein ACFLYE_01180 [Chloroflexota bacterium]
MGNIFDIRRDNELIAAGTHFWCQTHGTAQPLEKQSPDPRYCKECCEYLLQEAELLPSTKRSKWIPRIPKGGEHHTIHHSSAPHGKEGVTKPIPVGTIGTIPNEVMLQVNKKGGRPPKPAGVPVSRMTQYRRRQKETQGVLV